MAERLSNNGETESTCSKLRDAIREATGQRLIDRGFPPEMIPRFLEVVVFFNTNQGQTTFTLPGQAARRNDTLNVGFDVENKETRDDASKTHYYLSDEGLILQTGDHFKDPHVPLPEQIADDLAAKLSEPETTISVTLINNWQT